MLPNALHQTKMTQVYMHLLCLVGTTPSCKPAFILPNCTSNYTFPIVQKTHTWFK